MTTKTETKTTEIQLVQVPKIAHRLQELGAKVTERLTELNLEALVATEDTVKVLKELRAELNKELDNYESQRKWVKEGVMNPYNEFEAIYKTEISEKYKAAIDTLKTKIEIVETKVKAEKRNRVKIYFDELCVSEGVDFAPFEKMNLDINLSTSEKKYKEQCNDFIIRVKDDMKLISTEEHQAEIMAVYRKSLNAAQAITQVRERKAEEAREAEKLKVARNLRRIKQVIDAGMAYDEFSKTYVYNDEIFLSEAFIKDSEQDQFEAYFGVCLAKIKEDKAENPPQGEMQFGAPSPAAPVAAPSVKKTEELFSASFEVTGTMAQLRALGQYMKDNNLTYKNI